MASENLCKVLIIGSGPAGWTAAIYSARASLSPVLIHGPLPGGQLTTTTEVENFPGFPDGIQGPELMELMEKQAVRFGTRVITGNVTKVDLNARPFRIETEKDTFFSRALIIATGANPKYLGLEAEKELLGFGVSTCATCDGAFFRNQVIVVVGGGDSACEEALFLTRFGSKVYLVHRRDQLRASKIMQERVFQNEKIEILWNRQVRDIQGTRPTGVTGILLHDSTENRDHFLDCAAVFVAIGHEPNSALFKGQIELDDKGYIKPRPHSAMVAEGVFACGDVQDQIWRQAITAAGTGCMAAMEAERWLEVQGE